MGWKRTGGISYDVVFRSTGTNQVTFASEAEAQLATVVSDVFLRSSSALVYNSVSVGFDNSLGLSTVSAREWAGLGLYTPFLGPASCDSTSCGSFSGGLPAPAGTLSLAPGTYNIGTIVWDTSGIGAGATSLSAFLRLEDVSAVMQPPGSGNIVPTTGTETFGSALITVIPEPATAALIGLGLCGLILARRRAA